MNTLLASGSKSIYIYDGNGKETVFKEHLREVK